MFSAWNANPAPISPILLVTNAVSSTILKDPYSSEPGDDDGAAYSDFPNDLAYVTYTTTCAAHIWSLLPPDVYWAAYTPLRT